MQDDNTNQATDGKQDNAASDSNVIEPTIIGLGTNPLDQQSEGDNKDTDKTPDSQPAAGGSSSADDASSTTVPVNDAPADDSSPASDDSSEDKAETEKELPKAPVPEEETPADSSQSDGDLESIRTSALQELTPIVSELDQEPEEKYRTLMMIIQASDNQSLIKEAYETAEKIDDKKARAEALLTIVNEINYFTGKEKSQPEV